MKLYLRGQKDNEKYIGRYIILGVDFCVKRKHKAGQRLGQRRQLHWPVKEAFAFLKGSIGAGVQTMVKKWVLGMSARTQLWTVETMNKISSHRSRRAPEYKDSRLRLPKYLLSLISRNPASWVLHPSFL